MRSSNPGVTSYNRYLHVSTANYIMRTTVCKARGTHWTYLRLNLTNNVKSIWTVTLILTQYHYVITVPADALAYYGDGQSAGNLRTTKLSILCLNIPITSMVQNFCRPDYVIQNGRRDPTNSHVTSRVKIIAVIDAQCCLQTSIDAASGFVTQHFEAETKWSPLWRRHFQISFPIRVLFYFDWNSTKVRS